jgi:hypothetical protein
VDLFDPASPIQKGLVAENPLPHGFFKLGSVFRAMPGISEVKFVCTYTVSAALETRGSANPIAKAKTKPTNTGRNEIVSVIRSSPFFLLMRGNYTPPGTIGK